VPAPQGCSGWSPVPRDARGGLRSPGMLGVAPGPQGCSDPVPPGWQEAPPCPGAEEPFCGAARRFLGVAVSSGGQSPQAQAHAGARGGGRGGGKGGMRLLSSPLVRLPGEKAERAEAANADAAFHKCRYSGFEK